MYNIINKNLFTKKKEVELCKQFYITLIMKKYKLNNLDCANCALKLEKHIKELENVNSVTIDFATLTMHLDSTNDIYAINKIKELEPEIIPILHNNTDNAHNYEHDYKNINLKKEIIALIVSILFIILSFFFNQYSILKIDIKTIILFIGYLISGHNIIKKAIINIIKGQIFDENFLMFIATIGAFLIKAPIEALSVMIFYNLGELFQNIALSKSRKSIKSLIDIKPPFANLQKNNNILKVSPETLKIDDIIIIKPGEKIPIDGIILSGETKVDTSSITGESTPKLLNIGDPVISGTLNISGTITVRTTRLFINSSIYKIIDLIENATHKKAKTEKLITSFAKIYTPIVVISALLIAFIPPLLIKDAFFSDWIYRALVLMVISCPCALVISIPLGYFGGIGAFAKEGILLKGANFIDVLNSVDTVVFDKTGTLTKGNFEVTKINTFNGYNIDSVIETAAIIESHSNHPISESIRRKYNKSINENIVKNFKYIPGMGATGDIYNKKVIIGNDKLLDKENINYNKSDELGTIVYIAINGVYAGNFIIEDELKIDTKKAITNLENYGIENIYMLTGDNENIAKKIADQLNIKNYYSNLLPEDKLNILENEIIPKSNKVAFIGDGINDAISLARADIGISMGKKGSELAIEASDMVLLSDSIDKINTAKYLARKTRRVIIENIALAFIVKLIFFILGIFGIANIWEAIFADVGVALIAIINSTKILKIKSR